MESTDGDRRQIAFGCRLTDLPEDVELRKLVWIGRKGGWSCGRTKAGCWHIQIAAQKSASTAIGAEICMPNENALHQLIAALQQKTPAETLVFIESLPAVHAQAEELRLEQIRQQILRP